MDVTAPLTGTSPTAGAYTPRGSSALGKDEFLRLLVTQLSNQDPLNPLKGQEFAAQLAQFTSLEQLVNINDTLAAHGEMNGLMAQSINSGVAAGLIGKTVEADGNQIYWSGEGEAPIGFDLAAEADVEIRVVNAAGETVRTIQAGRFGEGEQQVAWDGATDEGEALPPGHYTFEVAATGADGASVEVTSHLRGRVDRVTFGQDGIRLWIGDVSVAMGAVRSVTAED